ncbi:uncharacterized protein LOC121726457 [Aricia agestis]|uniref:uncharacterized protein LOC121726457 n=1 Tax=Aricia agestis TaxID=91739 RepID=UPI001C206953|nr:uncharacterized protein LOC121726457 [Aricia agestis]XP_041969775.1 uncharacterized protein LOC121726457 [Aricia agestis]XP_041969776.1 uncharacterized protein LOC121726457 [Aricia agestis]XP_041969777.1 uncharacterized protein LOC121726457 [Aricia agestis]
MARILKNSSVRRRLFAEADDVTDQAKNDNLSNLLQESIAADVEEKKKKWNFDFENEEPLEGVYEWYKTDTKYDWIGVKTVVKEDSCYIKKRENEYTPTAKEQTQQIARVLKKRKLNSEVESAKSIRRKITFD